MSKGYKFHNKYKATCYKCLQTVEPMQGKIQKHKNGWQTQHFKCVGLTKEQCLHRANNY